MSERKPRVFDALKRVSDVVGASILGMLSLPLQVVIAVIVFSKLGRPIFFRQLRPGLDEEIFTLIKFRTMDHYDFTKGRITDAQRIGKFGEMLRATSLDELPSLWNVVRGDMSLVGPRPLLIEYLPLYNSKQRRRHDVRPGITGLAQVSGRNAISWESKFDYDIAYVDNRSFLMDIKIIFCTLHNVLLRKDVSADSHVTMPLFTGDRDNDRI